MLNQLSSRGKGFASAVGAYTLWGVLPIYWKFLRHVPALEILAHRIVWSFVSLVLLLVLTGKLTSFYSDVRAIWSQPKKSLGLVAAAVLVTVNWLIYIWAVNTGQIVETSLGYFINPLINVLLGVAVL